VTIGAVLDTGFAVRDNTLDSDVNNLYYLFMKAQTQYITDILPTKREKRKPLSLTSKSMKGSFMPLKPLNARDKT
jgi:hypothetical protein